MIGMPKIARIMAVVLVGIFATGCVLDRHKFEQSTKYQDSETLSGNKIYVYSLLDFREKTYGPKTLTEFEKQLAARFADVGVTAKVVNFRDTQVGSHFSVSNTDAYVPVNQIVGQSRNDEIADGAKYRLLILPSEVDSLANNFQITWIIRSTDNNRLVWQGVSRVHTDYIWSTDGLYIFNGSDIAEHAKYLLDPFFKEIKAQKLTP